MFNTLIVQPIFNILVVVYSILPGHNFGFALIIFTVLIRLLMWPLVKKQLHHAKAMRALQPEIKRIKKESKGDKAKEQALTLELYKERQVNPFSSIGLLLLQAPIFIALYSGINRIVKDPSQIVDFAYPAVQNLSSMKELAADISIFDATLFGFIDLTRPAWSSGVIYWPAMLIVVTTVFVQYYQSKQLMPSPTEKKSLRAILKDASSGKQADAEEMQAAVSSKTMLLLPILIFFVTVSIASALSLYLLVSAIVAIIQQTIILRQDTDEMEEIGDRAAKRDAAVEGEIIPPKKSTKPKKKAAKKTTKKRKRR
jgi:YidC/Oxa1 family membrane protein insertase